MLFIFPFFIFIAALVVMFAKTNRHSSFIGYKTKLTTQSDEHWRYTQKTYGSYLLFVSLLSFITTILVIYLKSKLNYHHLSIFKMNLITIMTMLPYIYLIIAIIIFKYRINKKLLNSIR